MSLEKLAKLLEVDEVSLMHGPLGMAIHVRIEKSWHSTTLDNETIEDAHGKRRINIIAERLIETATGLHKALGRSSDLKKAQVQERQPDRLSWRDVGGWVPYDPPTSSSRRIQRSEAAEVMRYQPPPPTTSEPAVSNSLPSRFHAIMAELKNL